MIINDSSPIYHRVTAIQRATLSSYIKPITNRRCCQRRADEMTTRDSTRERERGRGSNPLSPYPSLTGQAGIIKFPMALTGGCSAPKLHDFERAGAARFKHASTFHLTEQWPDYKSGRSRVTWPSDKALFNFSDHFISLSSFLTARSLAPDGHLHSRGFVLDFTCRCLASARRINWHPLNANPEANVALTVML